MAMSLFFLLSLLASGPRVGERAALPAGRNSNLDGQVEAQFLVGDVAH
jgi:hypothetical protein